MNQIAINMSTLRYTFKQITNCNMCGDSCANHKMMGRRLNASQGFRPKKKKGITTSIYRCTNCQLIYSNPMPIPFDIQDHYGVPPESYWVDSYFQLDENYLGDLPKKLEKYIDLNSNPKSLDIGAGIGKGMLSLANIGFSSYGIEPSKPFYDMAIKKMGILESNLQCVTIEDAVFEANSFDFITFGAVLEHLYFPFESLQKAMEWLKPGGIIQVAVPSSNWLVGRIINFAYKVRGIDFVGNLSPMHAPFHLYEFGKKTFELNAKKLGYEIVDLKYGVCDTMLPKVLDPILKPIMSKTNTGMEIYVLLRKPN